MLQQTSALKAMAETFSSTLSYAALVVGMLFVHKHRKSVNDTSS